jgi:hypothetical protein
MNKTLLRKTAAGGVALLSIGLASPAFATDTTPSTTTSTSTTTQLSTPTFTEFKAAVLARIAARQAALAAQLTKVQGMTPTADITAEVIQAKVDLINILQAKLTALQDAVNAAQSITDIQAALQAYWAPSLQELQARVNLMLARQLAELDEHIAKVTASTTLSTAQKTAITTALQAKRATLVTAQGQVQSAKTAADIKAALQAAGISGRHKRQDGRSMDRWSGDRKHHGRHSDGGGMSLGDLGGSGFGFGGFGQGGFGYHD